MGSIDLARELHDGLAQELVAMGYKVDRILANPETPNEVRSELRALRLEISGALGALRMQIYRLRSKRTIELARSIEELFASLIDDGQCSCENFTVSPDDYELLVGIARELLRNVRTHSGASRTSLDLMQSATHIILNVCDNGTGIAEAKDGHYGLLGIQEKVHERGGRVDIRTGVGTSVTVAIPL